MSSKKLTKSLRQALARLKKAVAVKSYAQLARILDVSPQAINSALVRGEIPARWILEVAQKSGARIDWLRAGHGPMMLVEAVAEAEAAYGELLTPKIRQYLARRAQLDETHQAIMDRGMDLLLASDAQIRTLMVQLLERMAERDTWERRQKKDVPQQKAEG